MAEVKIDKKQFTHYATFHNIPCYWNSHTKQLSGRTWYYDLLVTALAYFDAWFVMPFVPHSRRGFVIYLGEEINGANNE